MTSVVLKRDWSGNAFGLPNPKPLTKSWRVKYGIFAPAAVSALSVMPPYGGLAATPSTSTAVLMGQDSITAADLTRGLAVYAGYANGTYANINDVKARVGTSPVIVSITPSGLHGPRCFDIEPGDGKPGDAPAWIKLPSHGGPQWGQKNAGKPVIYCSAGDITAVNKACAAAGVPRSAYLIWSAHWIGYHICGPKTCGYPQADACQYNSTAKLDSDAWYSYCFTAPAPPPPPPPPPPADWHYAAPADLRVVTVGHTTVKLAWDEPPLNGHPKPDHYVVWIYDHGKLVRSYPRNVPGTVLEWEGGGMEKGVSYEAHVSASGPGTQHLGKGVFASVSFTTG